MVDAMGDQRWLVRLPTIQVLGHVWETQYIEEDNRLRFRSIKEMPAAADQISSPMTKRLAIAPSAISPGWDTKRILRRHATLRDLT
jgi:hypothetical protein